MDPDPVLDRIRSKPDRIPNTAWNHPLSATSYNQGNGHTWTAQTKSSLYVETGALQSSYMCIVHCAICVWQPPWICFTGVVPLECGWPGGTRKNATRCDKNGGSTNHQPGNLQQAGGRHQELCGTRNCVVISKAFQTRLKTCRESS